MITTKHLALLAFTLTTAACVGREVFFVAGCDDWLASPYKRDECRACVTRPLPHKYLPDQPDGARCYRR